MKKLLILLTLLAAASIVWCTTPKHHPSVASLQIIEPAPPATYDYSIRSNGVLSVSHSGICGTTVTAGDVLFPDTKATLPVEITSRIFDLANRIDRKSILSSQKGIVSSSRRELIVWFETNPPHPIAITWLTKHPDSHARELIQLLEEYHIGDATKINQLGNITKPSTPEK